jgi:predicted phosphoribosyltransferase
MHSPGTVVDLERMRDAHPVFRDRAHAGAQLAAMLAGYRGGTAQVLAIPAGGIPVAAVIARTLELPLDVAVVSKITLPWNTEAGYGAVAFDGTVRLNDALVRSAGLAPAEVEAGIAATREKVARRVRRFRGARPFPSLADRPAILVDDGLASGFTLQVAIAALRTAGAREIAVAVPTGHGSSVARIAAEVERLYCPNVRYGLRFAVADAYEQWSDVGEDEALRLLEAGRAVH